MKYLLCLFAFWFISGTLVENITRQTIKKSFIIEAESQKEAEKVTGIYIATKYQDWQFYKYTVFEMSEEIEVIK